MSYCIDPFLRGQYTKCHWKKSLVTQTITNLISLSSLTGYDLQQFEKDGVTQTITNLISLSSYRRAKVCSSSRQLVWGKPSVIHTRRSTVSEVHLFTHGKLARLILLCFISKPVYLTLMTNTNIIKRNYTTERSRCIIKA